jgi:hypothetical protein
LRLEQENSSTDYYINYNRVDDINIETQADANKVIIVESMGMPHITWKKVALDVGESYDIDNFD